MSKTVDNIAWSNKKLQIRWRRINYYDVEQIEEFVAFKGAYKIESLFEKYEDFDDYVYIHGNFCY